MAVRCLIIDDNDRFLEAAREALERDGIVVVGVATDGAQAMDQIQELRPNVVLVDACLGEESGFALTERIASACRAWRPCLILVSTYAQRDFEDLLEASSACAFLSKAQLSGTAIRQILADLGVSGVNARRERL